MFNDHLYIYIYIYIYINYICFVVNYSGRRAGPCMNWFSILAVSYLAYIC